MIYYLDTSALVKVYSYEKGTEAIIDLLKSKLPFYSSIIVYPEFLFTLRRKMENREMAQNEFSKQVGRFKSHFLSLINGVQFDENTLDVLENRVLQYSMRALDAIHLASAIWIRENIDRDCGFICSDKNLLNFAEKESFDLINPEK